MFCEFSSKFEQSSGVAFPPKLTQHHRYFCVYLTAPRPSWKARKTLKSVVMSKYIWNFIFSKIEDFESGCQWRHL